MTIGTCAYCGEQRELTRDHVPPKSLFGKPRPDNLITVPSCVACNKGAEKDDQYFYMMVTLGIDKEKFPTENANSVRAISKLQRSQSIGFAESLLREYEPNPGRMNVDPERIRIVLKRIVRGIFYHHEKRSMPERVQFIALRQEELLHEDLELVADLEREFLTIGPGAFRYAYRTLASEPPDPFFSVWLLRFYDLRTFLCFPVSRILLPA